MGDRWHGLRWPFKITAQGLFQDADDDELLESSIKFILSTGIGEYICLPEFGSKLQQDLFEPNDSVLTALVQRHVIEALNKWEPRLSVVRVNVETDDIEVRLLVEYVLVENPESLRFFSDTFERQAV
jgi:phage baseplate assembly protein W